MSTEVNAKHKKRFFAKSVNMLEGAIASAMLIYIVPIVLTSLLSALYSTADMTIIGHFGKEGSVAAIGASSAVTNFIITVSTAFSAGTNILLARAIGAGDSDRMQRIIGTSFILSIAIGIVMMSIAEAFAYPFLDLTNCPETVRADAALYMRCFVMILPANFFYSFMSNVLRLNGDTVRPFVYATAGGVTNVCLNLLFVIGFGMDIAGVAIATVISVYLQAALLFARLLRLDGPCRLNLRKIVLDPVALRKILKLGAPTSLSCVASSFSSIYMQIIVNSNGDFATAGNTAAYNLENYMFGVFGALGTAISAYMAQNIGAGNRERVKKSFFVGTLMITSFGAALMLITHLFGAEMLSALYLPNSPEAVAFGVYRLRYMLGLAVLCAMTYSISHAMQSFGFTFFQSMVDIVFVCAMRVSWLAFVYPLGKTPTLLYLTFPISWVAVILISGTYLFVAMRRYMRGKEYNV